MFGWGVFVSAAYNKATGSQKGLGGLDNRKSNVAATYTYARTLSHSITCTGSLSSELNGSTNFDSGSVNGGLGAKSNSSFSIQSSYTHSYSETHSASVPAKKNLTLYSQAYGVELTVYAIGPYCLGTWDRGQRHHRDTAISQVRSKAEQL